MDTSTVGIFAGGSAVAMVKRSERGDTVDGVTP
jgi:hypothetical protein